MHISVAILLVVVMMMMAMCCARPDDKYTTKFDNINVDEILESERLLNNYVACLKGSGKCTPDGSELKRVLPDALENECSKCSDKQKEGSKKVISFLVNKKPEVWKELMAIYDPEGKYKTKYDEISKKEGINI